MDANHIFLVGLMEIQPKATWKQLVLPKTTLERLHEFSLWDTHRNQVEKWGAQITGGPIALFSGPSGTGKTFAAEVLAHALGRPIFRIDLSMVLNKYIGETEKNLDALLSVAASENAVLLFDEADALFGKRSDVNDAHDRYANQEVSYLLARIEQTSIPCILTSNDTRELDPALAHKIQMRVDFPMPDSRARARLWRLYLAKKAPRVKRLSPSYIGRQLVLSAAQIRNAALYAALLAADDSSPLGWKHITKAALREISKTATSAPEEKLGKLRRYLA